jgi:hypothetical protein
MRRARRLVTAWIATCAVLMASLAPALSHALGSTGPATWSEICTSLGPQRVAIDDGAAGQSAPQAPTQWLEHCPYCSLHADSFALPPAPPALPEPLALGPFVAPAFLHADETPSVWASAQPRAPPAQA